ncbi:Divergent AAA domain family [Verrucomicrobiia bacterium DG1235]|nr:Divergent AAA domain family [Verrucomicrobiae bacterium DG1235]
MDCIAGMLNKRNLESRRRSKGMLGCFWTWKAGVGVVTLVLIGHPVLELLHRWRMGDGTGISIANSLIDPVAEAFTVSMLPITAVLGALGLLGGAVFARFQERWRRSSVKQDSRVGDIEGLRSLISQGEGERLEFKSSLRWDWRRRSVNKALEGVIAKTISGLMNQSGGVLLIGVDDGGSILGIENDLMSLRRKDLDGFEQRLMVLVTTHLGGDHTGAAHVVFVSDRGKTVALVYVDAVADPVFCKDGDVRRYYLRAGNTTTELDASEALAHIERKRDAS